MLPRSALPRSAASRGQSTYGNGPYSPPPAPIYYDYNHQRPPGVNSAYGLGLDRLPAYEWKPRPSPSIPPPPPPPPHIALPAMINGRKRQIDAYSPHLVKRQHLDSSSRSQIGPPLIQTAPPPPLPPPPPPPLRRPHQAVPGTSRSAYTSSDRSYPSPPTHLRPQVPAKPESSNSLQAYAKDKLSVQMVELFEACQQQSSDLNRKEMCRTRLLQDIQRIYADARLYLTGSSMNGLGCRSSDADMCLVIKRNKRVDPLHVLSTLQRLLRSLSYVEKTQLIRAKVPILRFREKGSDLEFDLNINNTVGIRNTFLLKTYAYADVRIRPLILVVKKWARHNQINDASKGTLSSYTLVLMVLHYLQTLNHPVLPSLQKDYPECFTLFMELDMVPEGPKHIPPYISRNQSCLGELLLGFLKYYATAFRWDKQVISVREARSFTKTGSQQWKNKYICVEEPFERNNVARAVHEKVKFEAIKRQFAESYRILQQKKDLNSILPVRDVINKELSRR